MRSLRARVKGRYLSLYSRLQLTEDQIDEFEKLMITSSGKVWRSAGDYVASFSGMISGLGEPLTIAQSEDLVQAMAETSPQGASTTYNMTSKQWDQIFARAKKILTPEQWLYFQTTTVPDQTRSRWSVALDELLTQTAGPQ